jgi:hypothetical protein
MTFTVALPHGPRGPPLQGRSCLSATPASWCRWCLVATASFAISTAGADHDEENVSSRPALQPTGTGHNQRRATVRVMHRVENQLAQPLLPSNLGSPLPEIHAMTDCNFSIGGTQ